MKEVHSRIGLFMTLGIGLRTWERIGSLYRELETYHGFMSEGWGVTIFTYDKANNIPCLNSKIKVKTKIPDFLPIRLYWLYAILIPFLFYRDSKKLSVLKTNQAHSGWPALWCGKIWRKKVIARCGYVFGEMAENLHLYGPRIFRKIILEKLTFKYADMCFLPTEHLKNWVIKNYRIDPLKIKIVPNYVNIDLFKPVKKSDTGSIKRIVSVGRLAEVKRFGILIDALASENWTLTLIGDGPLKKYLTQHAKGKNVSLNLIGNIPNQEIAKFLNEADVFIICSSCEGHPKALIEAMACGCACVGTDSPGIREIIAHGENGLLCAATPSSIKNAINTLLTNDALKKKIQKNARAFTEEHFSSKNVIDREIKLVQTLIQDNN